MAQGAADWIIRKPLILAVLGTSLTAGRLSGNLWWQRLFENARAAPEAVGPVVLQNFGKGSQQSPFGVATAPDIAAMNPTHILTEGFAINDSAAALGTVTRAQHMANMQTMHDIWKAKNPNVIITWQTMNAVSAAGASLRPDLQGYYDDEVAKAAAMGDQLLNNYYGVPASGPAAGWPKPMPDFLTDSFDGLHPIWDGALDTYLWPNVIFWLRQQMALYWNVAAPNPPTPPVPPDTDFVVIGGGAGGGGWIGGGGGAGGMRRARTVGVNPLIGPVFVGRGSIGGDNSTGIGTNGAVPDGSCMAIGTLGGQLYVPPAGYGGGANNVGGDGPNGGGAGNSSLTLGLGGFNPPGGMGNIGGKSGPAANTGGGGGGGRGGPGGDAAPNSGGLGGTGWALDVPGYAGFYTVCGGGAGGGYAYSRPAVGPGQGAGNYGGGGRGGGGGGSTLTTGEPGGGGFVAAWYPGSTRLLKGGSTFGNSGYTVHRFTRDLYSNFALRSQEFENASWGKSNATVAANIYTAPDKTATGDQLNATAAFGVVNQSVNNVPRTGNYVFSVFLAQITGATQILECTIVPGGAQPNMTFGADITWGGDGTPVITPRQNITAADCGVENASNGTQNWWRFWIRTTDAGGTGATINAFCAVYPSGAAASGTVGAWGAQFNQSANLLAYSQTQAAVASIPENFDRDMTGNAIPLGETAVADTELDASSQAWRAFAAPMPQSQNTGNAKLYGWSSTAGALPHYLRRLYQSRRRWLGYRLQAPDLPANLDRCPLSWEVYGSNDGFVTKTLIHSVANESRFAAMEERFYKLDTPGAYYGYEFRILANQLGNQSMIGRLDFCPGLEPGP